MALIDALDLKRLRTRKDLTTRARLARRAARKVKKSKLTPAEKVLLAEKRNKRQTAVRDALKEARQVVWEQAELLQEKLGNHNADWYHKQLLRTSNASKSTKAVSSWNAYEKKRLEDINAERASNGSSPLKLCEVIQQISSEWKALSPEEKKAVTADHIEVIKEQREACQRVAHNEPINAFHDVRANLGSIQQEIEKLYSRTGTECLLVAVRSNLEQYNPPYTFVTSNKVSGYFELLLKQPITDMTSRFEAYCLSGVDGVINKQANSFLELKKSAVVLIGAKLAEAAGGTVRMSYKNFEDSITAKYGIVLEGWPLANKFCSPGDLSTQTEVNLVVNAFKSNTARFKKLSAGALERWHEGRHQRREDDDTCDPSEASTSSNSDENALSDSAAAATASPADETIPPPTGPNFQPPPTVNGLLPASPLPIAADRALKRPSDAPQNGQASKRGKAVLGDMFINTSVTTAGGEPLMLTKKPRKVRSDKGKPRKKRGQAVDENIA